jgi:hypothetical protein
MPIIPATQKEDADDLRGPDRDSNTLSQKQKDWGYASNGRALAWNI